MKEVEGRSWQDRELQRVEVKEKLDNKVLLRGFSWPGVKLGGLEKIKHLLSDTHLELVGWVRHTAYPFHMPLFTALLRGGD